MPLPRPAATHEPANPRVDGRRRRCATGASATRTGLTLVDGAREVRRALEAGVDVVEAFVCEPLLGGRRRPGRARRARAAGGDADRPTSARRCFEKLAFGERAEGSSPSSGPGPSLARPAPAGRPARRRSSRASRSPGNLGAVLRTADGAGADAVIAASPRTDLFNPNAIRASAGTIFARARRGRAVGRGAGLAARRAESGSSTARVDAERAYTDADLTRAAGDRARRRGGRSHGRVVRRRTSKPVALPMLGVADSLNVSVAAAVLLYEARRQRDRHAGPAR